MSDPRITLPTPHPKTMFQGQIIRPSTTLYDNKSLRSGQQTELLFGQRFSVHAQSRLWVWGQAYPLVKNSQRAGYVGYVSRKAISQALTSATHTVIALRAPVFSAANIKSRIRMALPMNSLVHAIEETDDFIKLSTEHFIHKKHVRSQAAAIGEDFVSVALKFIGAPYVWGGTGMMGVDCSGLVQMAFCAAGKDAPRDADMQEAALGETVAGALKRGDLIFWPGHVGIMTDSETLLHANAFHMATAQEPYADAVARIGTPRSIKRL
ncbi:NlpC/P60 family protein [Litorimonas taeanensis]|uniref:NlpC/P60 family protein n=1 Tax=Litorimonas taeanensis TaxID=568099 RepID=A0A420WM45_9PROT|nr:NlpC/P60 family protein [Litorimonas taeanensis]RKQ72060.1 NlpC/P60 family protein [Litorimonas taeanensis]